MEVKRIMRVNPSNINNTFHTIPSKDLQKKLLILPNDLSCEYKTIQQAGGASPFLLHCHDGCEIFIMLEGEMNFYTEIDGKQLKRGDVICIPPYGFHRGELCTPDCYTRIVINVRDEHLRCLSTVQTDLSACFYRSSRKLNLYHLNENELKACVCYSKQLTQALENTHFGDDILADIAIRQLLILLNAQANTGFSSEYTGIMPTLVSQIFSYVDTHLGESISIATMAEVLHHNSTYISRCFKQVMGISLQQYIIAKRISLAQQLLRDGLSPSDVCFQAGFGNYSNFSRTFSINTGMSPKQYQTLVTSSSSYLVK